MRWLLGLALLLSAPAFAEDAVAPVAEWQPNLYGQTGTVRLTSARVRPAAAIGITGFGTVADDYLIEQVVDSNIYVGGHLVGGVGIADLVELSLATRGASNINTARVTPQFSLGDMYASAKFGMTFLPVAAGLDVRVHLPTQVGAFGYDLANTAITTQGLFSADLYRGMKIPVRVHANGGYVFQVGKYQHDDNEAFEADPNFYDGPDGQLLALATNHWFYDQIIAGVGVEVPLPYATPFLEAWYQAAVGLPENRGPNNAAYNLTADAHFIVTPGVRVAITPAFAFDAAVDIGLTGTGGLPPAATALTDGTPPNPLFLARVGLSAVFDPFGQPNAGVVVSTAQGGQLKGCINDDLGRPAVGVLVEGAALSGARLATDESGCFLTPLLPAGDVELAIGYPGTAKIPLKATIESGRITDAKATVAALKAPAAAATGEGRVVGYVTTKDDELVDADIEIWDTRGPRPAGRTQNGGFDLMAGPGPVAIVAKAEGFMATGVEVYLEPGVREQQPIRLKKAPKTRKASLQKDRVQIDARVPFDFKKPRLQSAADFVLDDVIDVLLRNPSVRVRVDVYAEALGTPEETQRLAEERAAALVDYLAEHGVYRSRLEKKGIALNPGDPDKARRVELVIIP